MDIEKLKELKKVVEEKSCRTVIEDDGEESVYEIEDKELMWALEECSTLIDEAITGQSVKSEEVQEAIEQMEDALSPRYLESDGEWTGYNEFSTSAIRTAIAALQAYQPWVSVEDRLPTEDDADGKGNVMAYFADGDIRAWEWDEIGKWNDDSVREYEGLEGITYWRSMLPEPPKGE